MRRKHWLAIAGCWIRLSSPTIQRQSITSIFNFLGIPCEALPLRMGKTRGRGRGGIRGRGRSRGGYGGAGRSFMRADDRDHSLSSSEDEEVESGASIKFLLFGFSDVVAWFSQFASHIMCCRCKGIPSGK